MKKHIRTRLLAGTLSLSLVSTALWSWHSLNNGLSSHPFLQELANKLDLRQQTLREEKIYLHLDKTWVLPGESLWFAAYVRDAQTYGPALSEVVYVQLLNPKGSVLAERTLLVQQGKALGDFEFDQSWAGGLYKIKAYSKRGAARNLVFEREIQVQKPVLPNLNMKLDFARKAYGPGDAVLALLDLNGLDKQPVREQAFDFVLKTEGREVHRGTGKTDAKGQARLSFDLPQGLAEADAMLTVSFPYKGLTESITRSVPVFLGKMDLQFFPEGGTLLAGVEQNLAFKALNEFGRPADLRAEILDEAGKVVAKFSSYHQGMGSLRFRAEANKSYQARITQPAGVVQTFKLPVAQAQGHALEVQQGQEALHVVVNSSREEELFLAVQSRGKMQFSKVINAVVGSNKLSISQAELPIGLAQITLFDSSKRPIAERLTFANAHKQLQIEVKTDKDKYLPREEVKVSIQVKDETGKPVSGNFSLSVVDDKLLSFADDRQGHLLSHFLLESELKGEIVEPNFYFDDPRDPKRLLPEIDRQIALDHLLKTQGWRGFTWKEVQEGTMPSLPDAERTLIKGQVLLPNGQPAKGARVEVQGRAMLCNAQGQFHFEDCMLFDKQAIKVTAEGCKPETVELFEYNQNLSITLRNTKILEGQVFDERGSGLSGVQLLVDGQVLYTTRYNGVFEAHVPFSAKEVVFKYPNSAYFKSYTLKNLKEEDQGQLKVKLGYTMAYRAQTEVKKLNNKRSKAKGTVPQINRAVQPDNVMELDDFVQVEEVVAKPSVQRAQPSNAAGAQRPSVRPTRVEAKTDAVKVQDLAANKEALPVDQGGVELKEVEQKLNFDGVMPNRKTEAKKPVQPQAATRYYLARTFYTPKYKRSSLKGERADFRNTIYWNPSVEVKNGEAQLSFVTSDALTQFRLSLEGLGQQGQIGRKESLIFSQKPLEMQLKLPAYALLGDRISLPLSLSNHSSEALNAKLQIELPKGLTWQQAPPKQVSLPAGQSQTLWLQLLAGDEAGEQALNVAIKDGNVQDELQVNLGLRPRGFPVRQVYAGAEMSQKFALRIDKLVAKSLRIELSVEPNVAELIIKGMESMLRMPSGCFEQTSSSNYPNVLVLQYLRQTGQTNPELEARTMQYLKTGYERLKGYESKSGGFHWWGYDPAHEALTAYGISQFADMSQVFDVDPNLMERSVNWLLNRRNGKGGWNLNPKALHSWAADNITNAYIVSCLLDAGYGNRIPNEVDAIYKDVKNLKDPYQLGLLAHALLKAKDARGETLIAQIAALATPEGLFKGEKTSIVNSRGITFDIEATAYCALSLMRSKDARNHGKAIENAMKWLQKQKNSYGYGSTLGTVVALKAFLAYSEFGRSSQESGALALYRNGQKVSSLPFEKGQKTIHTQGLEQYFQEGDQALELRYEGITTALPYELKVEYSTHQPQNAAACPLTLQTNLSATNAKVGQTVRMDIELSNLRSEGQGMSMAMIGIPSGLSLQAWQLKEMQDKNLFDYYEIFDGYLVLHFEQMKANEIRKLNIDLKAELAGSYQAPASCAFLYYSQEHRFWAAGSELALLP